MPLVEMPRLLVSVLLVEFASSAMPIWNWLIPVLPESRLLLLENSSMLREVVLDALLLSRKLLFVFCSRMFLVKFLAMQSSSVMFLLHVMLMPVFVLLPVIVNPLQSIVTLSVCTTIPSPLLFIDRFKKYVPGSSTFLGRLDIRVPASAEYAVK